MGDSEKRRPRVGQAVTYFDPRGRPIPALVTCVHTTECINVAFVSDDASCTESYGRKIERETSCPHLYLTQMHGGGWLFVEEEVIPHKEPKET